jgi:hypothetical protein
MIFTGFEVDGKGCAGILSSPEDHVHGNIAAGIFPADALPFKRHFGMEYMSFRHD